MSSNALFFGWNRSIPGREHISAEHFQEFVEYLEGQQKNGTLSSFEIVFLDPHGGDMNGFFLLRGESARLDALMASMEWVTHMTRAELHLDGAGSVRGATGALIMERMALWTKTIPS